MNQYFIGFAKKMNLLYYVCCLMVIVRYQCIVNGYCDNSLAFVLQ